MKYDHVVKFNGVYYAAGEEVPTEEVVQTIVESEEEKGSEKSPSFHLYKKSELEAMTVKEIRQIADERGLELPSTGAKAEIVKAFLKLQ